MPSIFPFFQWCETTWIFRLNGEHEWFYPGLETLHLFGLILLLGTIVILSLRLLGVLMPRQPIPDLAQELSVYNTLGLTLMLTTGPLMFVVTATRNYSNVSFWIKMFLLATALIFHFTYFRKLIRQEGPGHPDARSRFAAWGALILWFGVGAAGRSIGFLG